jgi:hypothetical protein
MAITATFSRPPTPTGLPSALWSTSPKSSASERGMEGLAGESARSQETVSKQHRLATRAVLRTVARTRHDGMSSPSQLDPLL